jgi:4-hydroxybenzoate polyprenyltransferase
MSQTQLANFSTFAGLVVLVLSQFGIVFPQDKLTFILAALWSLGSTAYNYWQRYKKGDVTVLGARK